MKQPQVETSDILDLCTVLWYNWSFLGFSGARVMKVRFLVFLVLSVAAGASAANPQVTLQVTGPGAANGNIVLELYPEKAPITVENFIDYVRSGFYNGLIFHRVKIYDPPDSYMGIIQGGGYDTSMVEKTTGPTIINESTNGLSNLLGTIAMARAGYPHSAISGFFINQIDNINLDFGGLVQDPAENYYYKPGYCVFGRVISGMSDVNAINELSTTPIADGRPDENVLIESATVTLEGPFCVEKLEGDVDSDCDVDVEDLMKFAIQWLNPSCEGCYSADFSGDGEVDFADFAKMSVNWLNCTSITTPCN